jgi:ethanolamine transporter EutH
MTPDAVPGAYARPDFTPLSRSTHVKRIVVTFGLISGALLSGMMLVSTAFIDRIGFDKAEMVGYTTMVLAFIMVFFGIRSYRDTVLDGTIGFGRAFQVGILITLISCVCYVVTWQVIYHKLAPDFVEKYTAHVLEQARASGATEPELAAQRAQMARFMELYKNPLVNVGITFVEPFPVGLVITLVCAGILRRKRATPTAHPANAHG